MVNLLRRPLVHQAIDYVVGLALAGSAVRSGDAVIVWIVAIAVIVNASIFDGPLAAFRVVSRKSHRVLDVVLSFGCVAAAVAADIGAVTRLALLATATVLTFTSVRFTHGIRETRT